MLRGKPVRHAHRIEHCQLDITETPAANDWLQVKQWVDATQTPGSLNRVISLQLEAFWQQHGRTVMVAGALGTAYVMW